jgi:RNA polymerase sigma factor (sigma-70 family)
MRAGMDDWQLLQAYAKNRSEAAFAELVRLHLDWVYSVALRHVGNPHLAEDVVQSVFVLLARKARDLGPGTQVGGWLFRTTRLVAGHARRAEQRRKIREATACTMSHDTTAPDTDEILWEQLAPHLDQAVAALSEADRSAILLRFYERMPLGKVGERLGVSEEAARKRVSRALEKLREFLDRRGVKLSCVALGAVLAEKTVQAASAALAGAVVKICLAAASASASTMLPQLARETLRVWHFAKLKLAAGLAAGSLALIFVAVTAGGLLPRHAAPQAVAAIASPGPLASTSAPAAGPDSLAPAASTARGDVLVLRLVAADTDMPVARAVIEREVLDRRTGRVVSEALLKLATTEQGICEVPLPSEPPGLLLVRSRIDGFVDTTLAWSPARGEGIPAEYTLRLPHSVPIGGLVLDEDDKPVSGAEVRISVGGNQSPDIPHMSTEAAEKTVTDAEGRWRVDRFAKEAFSPTDGSGPSFSFLALHPDYFQDVTRVYGSGLRDQVRTQLLSATYVSTLARIVALRGTVVDTNGQPVPNVMITVDNLRGSLGASGITNQADGTFAMAPCRAGANGLRFEAPAFAMAKLEVELKPDMAPLRVTLQPAKPMRLRILDRNGVPVPGAGVTNRTFVSSRPLGPPSGRLESWGTPRVLFSHQADAEGRVRWDNPPDGLLSLEVAAAGLRSTNVLVRADGEEHVITLAPALTVLGTVRDAAMDKSIPRFTLSSRTGPIWHDGVVFRDGTFRYVDEEAVIGRKDPRRFKFEAKGYEPVVSREVQPDAGEVQLDIKMQPAASTTVTVLLPDGALVTNADIGLVEPGANLMVVQGGLRRPSYRGSLERPSLDDQGRFTLPPCEAGAWVVAAAPEGYAAASAAALAADPTLRLQPWARLEGTCLAGGKPAAGASFRLTSKSPVAQTLYDVEADENGHFTFPTVPPGNLTLSKWSSRGTRRAAPNALAEVVIQPGETKTMAVGAYNVTARLRWPEGIKREAGWSILAYYLQTQIAGPTPPGHRLTETPDGALAAEDLVPGSYLVKVSIAGPPGSDGLAETLLRAELPFTVPAEPSNGTLDLGEIVLQSPAMK